MTLNNFRILVCTDYIGEKNVMEKAWLISSDSFATSLIINYAIRRNISECREKQRGRSYWHVPPFLVRLPEKRDLVKVNCGNEIDLKFVQSVNLILLASSVFCTSSSFTVEFLFFISSIQRDLFHFGATTKTWLWMASRIPLSYWLSEHVQTHNWL